MRFTLCCLSAALAFASSPLVVEPVFFRSQALVAPLPNVPANILARGLTVQIVVEAEVTPGGSVTSVRILDNSRHDLAAASAEAIRKWKFKPIKEIFPGQPEAAQYTRLGRVVLYFRAVDGRITVADAAADVLAGRKAASSVSP